jgi:hypothetical protein
MTWKSKRKRRLVTKIYDEKLDYLIDTYHLEQTRDDIKKYGLDTPLSKNLVLNAELYMNGKYLTIPKKYLDELRDLMYMYRLFGGEATDINGEFPV